MASCAKAASYSCKLDNRIVTLRKSLIPVSLSCNGDIVARSQPKAVIGHHLSSKDCIRVSSRGTYYFVHHSRKTPKTINNPALLRLKGSNSAKNRCTAHASLSYNTLSYPKNIVFCAKSEKLPPDILPPTTDFPSPAQLSFILDKLRTELPHFFHTGHKYDVYEKRMIFQNNLMPLYPLTLRSKLAFQTFMLLSRFYYLLRYCKPQVDLIKITKDVDCGKIDVRWRIHGSPNLFVWLQRRVILEGFSTIIVNSRGHVSVVKFDKVMPSPKDKSKFIKALAQLGLIVGLTRRPVRHEPGIEGFLASIYEDYLLDDK